MPAALQSVADVPALVVGGISVLMLIVGVLRYITSPGEQRAISTAKSTILYAGVGFIIALLVQGMLVLWSTVGGAIFAWVFFSLPALSIVIYVVRRLVRLLVPTRFLVGKAARFSAQQMVELAIVIGGPVARSRWEEWRADLERADEGSTPPSPSAQLRHAVGLMGAGLRFRVDCILAKLESLLDRLLDWTLAKPRSEWIVTSLTTITGVYFWRVGGFRGLMEQLQNVAVVASLIVPAVWLRKLRGVPPVRRSSHGDSEDEHED